LPLKAFRVKRLASFKVSSWKALKKVRKHLEMMFIFCDLRSVCCIFDYCLL